VKRGGVKRGATYDSDGGFEFRLPKQLGEKPLDPRSSSLRMPGMAAAVRVTTDADVFECSG